MSESKNALLRLGYYTKGGCVNRRNGLPWACFSACWAGPQACHARKRPPDPASTAYTALADAQLSRAKGELERIRTLVAQGTLPNSWLKDAEVKFADAEDQETITRIFYGKPRVQDISDDEAKAVVDAAGRRVARQEDVVKRQLSLVNEGVLARTEAEGAQHELESRKRILEIAQSRVKLMHELREMASVEARLRKQYAGGDLNGVMIRYEGRGVFHPGELPSISNAFERRFHHALPVSASGQTALHRSLGLDHRERVDVALNPDGAEGIWLRQFLEGEGIPYLAFRSAVPGAATAPHIHIGPESSRLKLAQMTKRGL